MMGNMATLNPAAFQIYKGYEKKEPKWTTRNAELLNHDLKGYPHYMLKEIEEIPGVIKRIQDNYFDGEKFLFSPAMLKAIEKADKITFLACGTSYYACLMGVRFMHFLNRRASASIASEFAYDPFTSAKHPVYILLSQSGETADLIRCQKIINERGEIASPSPIAKVRRSNGTPPIPACSMLGLKWRWLRPNPMSPRSLS
jgi:glucosamine 6-phosphate synthetase-like amidotransferase/phosphosugar isomerase protein